MPHNEYRYGYDNSFALVVGINNYQNMSPLRYACDDADSIKNELVSKFGFPSDNITLLKDDQATRVGILDAFYEIQNSASSIDDRVIIFLSGHGTTLKGQRGNFGYFVPFDGHKEMPASLIRWGEFLDVTDLFSAKHIWFVFDACYSGLAFRKTASPGTQRFLSDLLQRRSIQVITAGKDDQTVADGGGINGKNSLFTSHLLEGLSGKAAGIGGVLTAAGLMQYVYERLGTDPIARQTPQYGQLDGEGDMILAPNLNLAMPPEHDELVQPVPPMAVDQTVSQGGVIEFGSSFLEAEGYGDPKSPNFGRNEWSNSLGIFDNLGSYQGLKTLSWFAVVVEPLSAGHLSIDIAKEQRRFINYAPQGEGQLQRFFPPRESRTTQSSLVLFSELPTRDSQLWKRYVRIEKSGALELGDSDSSFFAFDSGRAFRFVQTVGLAWQFMFFAKFILGEYGYKGPIRLAVNLVGTRGSILADFAKGRGPNTRRWKQPGEDGIFGRNLAGLTEICADPNLQMKYELILEQLDEQRSKEIVINFGDQAGLAYNHRGERRFFNFGTESFPWNQYAG